MRAGADAEVIAELPVVQVVARTACPGLRVGRDFVMLDSRPPRSPPRSVSCMSALASSSGSGGGYLANSVFGSSVR